MTLPTVGAVAADTGSDHEAERAAYLEAQGAAVEADDSHVCTDECCASVTKTAEGRRIFTLPFASIITMLGGALLVTAHVLALRGS